MDSYRRQPQEGTPAESLQAPVRAAADDVGRLPRRLLPYPSSGDTSSSLAIPLLSPRGSRAQEAPAPNAVLTAAGPQAATIISEAASILDEEMAGGVLAARGARQTSRYTGSDSSSTVLRQMHDLIDNMAAIWPSLQGASTLWPGASEPAASAVEHEPLAELKPASALRPGQRATISMTLCNKESRSVRLVPAATDLLGSTGGRISSQLLEFVPREIRLEPREQKEMEIAATIPPETVPGCYSGMLVVSGVNYLRALIAITVI